MCTFSVFSDDFLALFENSTQPKIKTGTSSRKPAGKVLWGEQGNQVRLVDVHCPCLV
jgi:hypothetical protein